MRIERLARSRKAMVFGFVLALVIAGLLLTAKPAHAATFTVNSTGDVEDVDPGDGVCDVNNIPGVEACTLRGAIQEANATRGKDTIGFDIGGGSGVKTISPASQLPTITEVVTIDGYTQPGASKNTQEVGTDAVLVIELSGAGAGDFKSGLTINASNVVVRGLVINRWVNQGVQITSGGSGAKIEGNFIGTDSTGTQDLGNSGPGVDIFGEGNTVGGATPEARNLISGNGAGVQMTAIAATGNRVEGNLIGTKKDGIFPLGNSFGVVVSGGGTGNRILSNSIFSNSQLGIDLLDEFGIGVTPNDPKDPDTGPNNLQNFPDLSTAKINPDGTVTITGTLNSRPRKTFTIQFFSSPEADPSGFGEGKTFLGQKMVKTSRKGNRSFSFTFTPAQPVTAGEFVTATATRNSTGDTSEFSGAVTVS